MKLWNHVAIVGVGLIGGSIGLEVIRRGMARHVVGIGRRDTSLAAALQRGAVHETTTHLAEGVAKADLVVVCTPVGSVAHDILAAAAACPAGALVTDAGSTKAQIVRQVEKKLCGSSGWKSGVRFLGGHPIAGTEKKGPEHARHHLFEGRVTVLTPTEHTDERDRRDLAEFWTALGSRVVEMSPDEHDRALAAISHVPHAVASALAAATPAADVPLAAGGWLDTTRVAAGDPELWQQILLSNEVHVLAAIERFRTKLAALRDAIERHDVKVLEQLLTEGKQVRDAVGS